MKIADSDTIKTGEQDLLDTLKEKLDSKVVEALAAQNLQMEDMFFRGGDIVIHENKIAYKLELEAKVAVSLLFDRDGNTLSGIDGAPEETGPGVEASDVSDEDFQDEAAQQDINEPEEVPEEIVANEDDTNEDMETILQRNRSFWMEKSGAEAPETEMRSEFEDVLQKNRDFWTAQS